MLLMLRIDSKLAAATAAALRDRTQVAVIEALEVLELLHLGLLTSQAGLRPTLGRRRALLHLLDHLGFDIHIGHAWGENLLQILLSERPLHSLEEVVLRYRCHLLVEPFESTENGRSLRPFLVHNLGYLFCRDPLRILLLDDYRLLVIRMLVSVNLCASLLFEIRLFNYVGMERLVVNLRPFMRQRSEPLGILAVLAEHGHPALALIQAHLVLLLVPVFKYRFLLNTTLEVVIVQGQTRVDTDESWILLWLDGHILLESVGQDIVGHCVIGRRELVVFGVLLVEPVRLLDGPLLHLIVEVGCRLSFVLHSLHLLRVLLVEINARLLSIDVQKRLSLALFSFARLLRQKVTVNRVVARSKRFVSVVNLVLILVARAIIVEFFIGKVEVEVDVEAEAYGLRLLLELLASDVQEIEVIFERANVDDVWVAWIRLFSNFFFFQRFLLLDLGTLAHTLHVLAALDVHFAGSLVPSDFGLYLFSILKLAVQ